MRRVKKGGVFTWLLLLILAGTTDTPVWACSAGLRAIQYIIPAIHGPEGRGRPSRDVGSVLCRESGVASGSFGGSSAGSFGGPATISTARFLGLGPSAPVVAPVPASMARAGWSDGGAPSWSLSGVSADAIVCRLSSNPPPQSSVHSWLPPPSPPSPSASESSHPLPGRGPCR